MGKKKGKGKSQAQPSSEGQGDSQTPSTSQAQRLEAPQPQQQPQAAPQPQQQQGTQQPQAAPQPHQQQPQGKKRKGPKQQQPTLPPQQQAPPQQQPAPQQQQQILPPQPSPTRQGPPPQWGPGAQQQRHPGPPPQQPMLGQQPLGQNVLFEQFTQQVNISGGVPPQGGTPPGFQQPQFAPPGFQQAGQGQRAWGPPSGQPVQAMGPQQPGSHQQLRGPPQQQQGGFTQQQGGTQQQQRGPPQGQQQQKGPPQGQQQQQKGPPQGQQQQWGPPPGQQQQQRGPPQGQQHQQRGPPQGQQQQQISPQQGQQQQQMSPPLGQQQQQRGPPQGQQQQQRGPPQGQQQQQRGPPQGQQQQQRGPPQGQQQQQRGPPQGQQQQQKGPQQQQQRQGTSQKMPPTQSEQPRPGGQQQKPSSSPPLMGKGDCLKQLVQVTPGTKGRRIRVESNHLALNLGNLMQAVHYDVAITPDTPKCMLRDVLNIFGKKHYPDRHPAFDGRKNLYSPTLLPFGDTDSISDTIKVEGENRSKEFKVDIKFARTVDLSPLHNMLKTKQSPQDALQCLDIVLRNAPSNRCITAGRCFFTPPKDQIFSLGDGMELYYGFYQSAIRGWKPLLNVDVAHKAFPSALNLLDVICELGSDYKYTMQRKDLDRPLQDYLIKNLDKFIKTLKVKYEITGQSSSKRIYRVNGLGTAPSRAEFKLEDGKTTTVEKYFQDVKRTKLRYPHLPTLWVGAKERDSKILLPLEFCSVVEGQAVNRKMNENQTAAMIKKSATSTDVRKKKIMTGLDEVRYNQDPCVREFGFSVNNQFETLDARVLDPPSLKYASGQIVKPSRGTWRSDRSKFFSGATINKWTIMSATRQPPRNIEYLADQIYRMAPSTGISIATKATQPFGHVSGRQTLHDFVQFFKTKKEFDLIFVVVPNSGQIYSLVKNAAEIGVGCLTQCIKERTLNKLNPQTVGNILLKVNSKLNGTNHILSSKPFIMTRPCIIMGADVTHPSPEARDIPSVAAVTASHDPQAFQYNICWRLQPPKVEIIEDLCNITKEQLMFFYKKTGFKPERIIFFRDGVSEGQFKEVQRAEIFAIQKACKALQREDYEPKITFLVVQKRHHTRLFPKDPKDSEDRNMNVPAGTCVDSMITNPMMQDFYLVSHASIQGVAKPTKYCTLWDDNGMSHDDIEELAYHLCHMFTRCNRSVSYPAPTYYAHLAAARAKVYIENDKLNMEQLPKHQESYQIKECISKEKPMFFV